MATTGRITANRKNLSATIHFVANGSCVVAGNNSVSDIALPGEVITGATITQVWHGSNAHWIIKRGANTVAVLDSTSYVDFAGCGNALTLDSTQNLSVELVGTSNGYIMIELQKLGASNLSQLTANSDYFQN